MFHLQRYSNFENYHTRSALTEHIKLEKKMLQNPERIKRSVNKEVTRTFNGRRFEGLVLYIYASIHSQQYQAVVEVACKAFHMHTTNALNAASDALHTTITSKGNLPSTYTE